jgi:hypothetical protein
MNEPDAADLQSASSNWLKSEPEPLAQVSPPAPSGPEPRVTASAWDVFALIAGIGGPVLALFASLLVAVALPGNRASLPLLLSIFIAVGMLGVPLAWHAGRRLQGLASPRWQSHWGWLAAAGGVIVLMMIVGQTAVSLALVPEWVLAVAQPVIFVAAGAALLAIAAGDWPGLSRVRAWGHLVSGAWFSVLLAFTAEVVLVGGLGIVVLVAWLAVDPDQAREILALLRSMESFNPDAFLEFALQPLAVVLTFLVVSLLIPMVEELLKPLGVILLLGRRPVPMDAFLGGVLGGLGFAITETLSNLISISDPWFLLVLARMGTLAMHGLTAGIVGWGWGQLAARRPLRLAGAFAGAVLLHGVWNGCVVVLVFAGLYLAQNPDFGVTGMMLGLLAAAAVFLLILLVPLSVAGLALIGYRLRSSAQQHGDDKPGQGQHPPPAPGLVDQPVKPLEPGSLQPERGPRGRAGDEVERAAHADHHRHLEPIAIAHDPFVLGRRAVGHE